MPHKEIHLFPNRQNEEQSQQFALTLTSPGLGCSNVEPETRKKGGGIHRFITSMTFHDDLFPTSASPPFQLQGQIFEYLHILDP